MGAKLVTVYVINQTSDTWQFATQNIGFTRIDAGCSTSYKEDRKVKCNIHFRHENQKCESFKYEFDTNNQIYCNDVTFIIFETDNCKIALRCVNDGVTHYRPNEITEDEYQRQEEEGRRLL